MRLSKDRVAAVVNTDFAREKLEASDRAQAGNNEGDQVWNLLVSEIEPDPNQPRRHFSEPALRELADDIARRGVLQPIIVHPIVRTGDEGKLYRIVVGERRWRASQLAGKPRIPCLVRDLDGQEKSEAQLVENVLREGISDIERGLALRNLYEEMKTSDRSVTWDTVAQRVGLSRMRIHHLHSLSLLPEPIIALIQNGRLSGSHGTELARLAEHPNDQLFIAEKAARPEGVRTGSYGMSVAQVREWVNDVLAGGSAEHRQEKEETLAVASKTAKPRGIERHLLGVTAALRPDLAPDIRERLRRHAQDILRYLEGGGGDEEEAPGSPDREQIVKSTLQNQGR